MVDDWLNQAHTETERNVHKDTSDGRATSRPESPEVRRTRETRTSARNSVNHSENEVTESALKLRFSHLATVNRRSSMELSA